MQQARNFLLFIAISILIVFGWMELERRLWPRQAPDPAKKTTEQDKDKEKENKEKPLPKEEPPKPAPSTGGAGFWTELGREITRRDTYRPTPIGELVTLGSKDPSSPYHLQVVLDPKGASVRSVLLNRFKEGDDKGRPTEKLLELVPDPADPQNRLVPNPENWRNGSFHLFHYEAAGSVEERPLDTLGKEKWEVEGKKEVETLADGRKRETMSYFTDKVPGVRITKTFTLTEGEYHIGLTVKMKRTAGGTIKFRYQLAGAHGLPVEGKWYTSTFRNALIGRVEKNSVWRELQDLRQISIWGGGKPIGKEKNYTIRYAGVAVQFFASVIVVDDEQQDQEFLSRARATLETFVVKGRVKRIESDRSSFVLETDDHKDETIVVPEEGGLRRALAPAEVNHRFAVIAATDSRQRIVALAVKSESETHALWTDDITVRVTTEQIELRPGQEVVHKYLLYHGPVKPSLLGMPGKEIIKAEVIARYVENLKLNTLTDYQSPGWLGSFSSTIYLTNVIIWFTNLMHWILGQINRVIPNYGLCIICLTVLVRMLMFPISRKQTMMGIRMQALAPEMKKLQEKYKTDRQTLGMETMALYRKHGVNPFGTCWFLLMQMPIFMGLYFALQESIYFRLADAWPLWVKNLAAPDMMINWGESIPWISRPQDYGGFLYLGPYLNLLPIIAVALMIVTQKMMTPPPQDEQQEMQQKVMKYMMVFFGFMFFKVAAGLAIYFIATNIWGICERKLLPKKKLDVGKVSAEASLKEMIDRPAPSGQPSTAVTTASPANVTSLPDGRGRGRKQGRNRKGQGDDPKTAEAVVSNSPWSRFRRRLGAWWSEVLKKAEKK